MAVEKFIKKTALKLPKVATDRFTMPTFFTFPLADDTL
jgi:hypothetical protein